MNTQPFLTVPEAFYNRAFKWIWRGALASGLVFGGCSFIWPKYSVPLMLVPFIGGGIAGAVVGWIGGGGPAEEKTREFASNFWLRLGAKEDGHEIDLFEIMVPEAKERGKIHRLKSTTGEVFVINAQRFQELLISRSLEDAERATEHALAVAWQKCCGELRPDLDPLLSKAFRSAFTQDLNGSIVRLMAIVGEKLIEELRAQAEPPAVEQKEPFELIPLAPTEGPRVSKRPKKSK